MLTSGSMSLLPLKKDKIWNLWMYLRIKTSIKSWNHSVRQPGSLLILRRESAWGVFCLFKQTNLINPVKVLPRVLLLYLSFIPSSQNAGWGEEVPLTNAENKSCFIPNKWGSWIFPTTKKTINLNDAITKRPTQRHFTPWESSPTQDIQDIPWNFLLEKCSN